MRRNVKSSKDDYDYDISGNGLDVLKKVTKLDKIVKEQNLLKKIQTDIIISTSTVRKTFAHIIKNPNHYHLSVKFDLDLFIKNRTEESKLDWRGMELIKDPSIEEFLITNTIYDTIISFNRQFVIKKEKIHSLRDILTHISQIGLAIRYMMYSVKTKSMCLCSDIYQSTFFVGFIFDITHIDIDNILKKQTEDYYLEVNEIIKNEKVAKILDVMVEYNGFLFYNCECLIEDDSNKDKDSNNKGENK